MEPISHNVLVHMIKHRILQTGLTQKGICERMGIKPDELMQVLNGNVMASSMLLARLAIIFEMDWGQIAARYALWRFYAETAKGRKVVRAYNSKVETIFDMLKISKEMIEANPHLPSSYLVDEIHEKTLLDKSAIRNQVAHVRAVQSGDYRFG